MGGKFALCGVVGLLPKGLVRAGLVATLDHVAGSVGWLDWRGGGVDDLCARGELFLCGGG